MIENVTEVDLDRLRRIGEAIGLDWVAAMAEVNDPQAPLYGLVELIADIAGHVNHELEEMRIEAIAEVEVDADLARIARDWARAHDWYAEAGAPCPACSTPRKRVLLSPDDAPARPAELCANPDCITNK